ncbi:MAG: type II and III secretion system protein family protein [Pseudomonadota bacterium]
MANQRAAALEHAEFLAAAKRAFLVLVAATILLYAGVVSGLAQSQVSAHAGGETKSVKLGLSKSIIVKLPRNAADVLVSDPETADAVVRSARRAYVIGKQVGQTNIFFFDANGGQILALDVQVERDIGMLKRTLRNLLPGSHIDVESLNDNVILTGSVRNASDATTAMQIAARFVDAPENVINMVAVDGEEQVYLKVTVAEVERVVIKQLGIDLQAVASGGNATFAALTQNPFSVAGQTIANNALATTLSNGSESITATVRAMEQRGLLRTLAEPTLTAVSGEKAEFLAGGEFPVPVGRDDNDITIEYKPFGVVLEFTPVVLSGGRISLTVKSEVSELTADGAFTFRGGVTADGVSVGDLTIPALKVRRASTTIELPSGGAMGIAGLIKEETRQNINGVPGLMDLPVLGALFKSRDFQRSETELMVIVTPYTVKPVSPDTLARPTDGLIDASDPATALLGRINRVYSPNGGTRPSGAYRGHYGFIYD